MPWPRPPSRSIAGRLWSWPTTSRPDPDSGRRPGALVVLALSYAAGAVPFSGLAARLTAGADLRHVGSGTVSGTGLYQVAGFRPLAVAGSLDVAKGALGPALAGRDRPVLAAVSAGLAVTGHNWSPLLGGAGGRGISTALGSTLACAPEGAVVLGASLAAGRLLKQTGLVTLLGLLALFPLLVRRRGLAGLVLAMALACPMVGKRLVGNAAAPPGPGRRRVLLWRLLFDRDPDEAAAAETDTDRGGARPGRSGLEADTDVNR